MHLVMDVNIYKRFSDIEDACGDPDEKRPFILGKESTDERSYPP